MRAAGPQRGQHLPDRHLPRDGRGAAASTPCPPDKGNAGRRGGPRCRPTQPLKLRRHGLANQCRPLRPLPPPTKLQHPPPRPPYSGPPQTLGPLDSGPRRNWGWPGGQFSRCDLPRYRSTLRRVVAGFWPPSWPRSPRHSLDTSMLAPRGTEVGSPGARPPGLVTRDPERRLLWAPEAPTARSHHFPVGGRAGCREIPRNPKKTGAPS